MASTKKIEPAFSRCQGDLPSINQLNKTESNPPHAGLETKSIT